LPPPVVPDDLLPEPHHHPGGRQRRVKRLTEIETEKVREGTKSVEYWALKK